MSLTPEQIAQLQQPLDHSRVATRQGGGGMTLSYLEGFDVIDAANRIFGFDGWSMYANDVEFSERIGPGGAYLANVTVNVSGVSRTDVGIGVVNLSRNGGEPTADEHDKAIKTSVTDAMKRALRTFGAQFGNVLYDKDYHAATSGQGQQTNRPPAQASRPASSGGNRPGTGFEPGSPNKATDKQLGFLRKVADAYDVDAESFAVARFGYGVERLGKRDASQLIEAIQAGNLNESGRAIAANEGVGDLQDNLPPAGSLAYQANDDDLPF